MQFWIDHPATQDGPVGFRRYLLWHLSGLLNRWSRKLHWWALCPGQKHDEIPF
jgi:hypothetical protein